MYPNISTTSSLTVVINSVPHAITTDHPNYDQVFKLVNSVTPSERYDTELLELLKPIERFKRVIGDADSNFQMKDNVLRCIIDGEEFPLAESLYEAILRIYSISGNLQPMYNFVVKLSRNPRKEVIDELWSFISSCGLAITESGNFLAYKSVTNDYKDIYTGTMDNSPGTVVEMPRWKVEHDPNRTCAAGLHFAAWDYAYGFGNNNTRKMIISISPEDVVSIPSDYSNQKGRACKYTILREVTKNNELADHTVFTDSADAVTWEYWDADEFDFLPVDVLCNDEVEVCYENEEKDQASAASFDWSNQNEEGFNIVKYRILE